MIKRSKKNKKVNFLLENNHYRKLHLYLYLVSVLVIVSVYFLILVIFSKSNLFVTALISLGIGFFMVFNRDKIVKLISDKIQEKKLKTRKKENKQNLKSTIRKITPKPRRNINLKIGGRETFKDRFNNIKTKLNPKKKKKSDMK